MADVTYYDEVQCCFGMSCMNTICEPCKSCLKIKYVGDNYVTYYDELQCCFGMSCMTYSVIMDIICEPCKTCLKIKYVGDNYGKCLGICILPLHVILFILEIILLPIGIVIGLIIDIISLLCCLATCGWCCTCIACKLCYCYNDSQNNNHCRGGCAPYIDECMVGCDWCCSGCKFED